MAIKTIAIVQHVHTDYGYTDHPNRTKREQVKYIDQAIDYVLSSSIYPEGARFAWTQEQIDPFRRWWNSASQERKEKFFAAFATGRLEIAGTPFNVTALMDKEEWETAMHWIEDDLWDACKIQSAMQIDVNGMHTSGMVSAYNRGIRNLFIGPNSYYGAPPMPTPTAFNWQIDVDKKMFVWLNSAYNDGTFMFNENWRQGPVPNYSDLRYRPPEAGDIWASDDDSIMKAYRLCQKSAAMIEGSDCQCSCKETDGFTKNRVFGGYKQETLIVSVTGQWRVDNDPPFYPIVDFVKRWNELNLQPRLVLCTVTQAMNMVKEEMGEEIPTYSGEWIDWWANGNASAPVEMSYNREAKRTLKAAKSPLFGPMSQEQKKAAREIMENICMYDEHCFSSWQSVSNPYSFANLSQTAEKNTYVYRALDGAQCLLAERVRVLTQNDKNRIVVFNPSEEDLLTFIELPLNCMRGMYYSVQCEETCEIWAIDYVDGVANFLRPNDPSEFSNENVSRTFSDKCEKQGVRFGPVRIPAGEKIHLVPLEQMAERTQIQQVGYMLQVDENGWPIHIQFEGQDTPVIDGSCGDFIAVRADGFSPRWTFKDIFENDNIEERKDLRARHIVETQPIYQNTVCVKSAGMLRFEQPMFHDSFLYAIRVLTVDLINACVNLEFRMNRRSNFNPEVLFLQFDAVRCEGMPWISNAGVKFRPEVDQLPGSCMDFYAVDGWVHYPNGWLLNSVDSALVTFGTTSVVARKTTTDGPVNKIYVRLFDNIWDTNFGANACGMMRFRFNIAADVPQNAANSKADAMAAEPVVVVKTGYLQ